jgi:acyl-CoA thioester hydrolase
MRWDDLDLLGHVNNAVYVDYLQEARVDMLRVHARDRRADELAEGVVVVRHQVEYIAPLEFRFEPVRIDTWVTEVRAASFTLAYEVYDEAPAGRQVYARATTVLTPYVFATERPRRLTSEERAALERYLDDPLPLRALPVADPPAVGASRHYPVRVRFSDVDVYGHVNNVIYFVYFQEARIPFLAELGRSVPSAGGADELAVVARTDVDYRRPILFRAEPYHCVSGVLRVGTTSLTLGQEIRDGDEVLSRARVVLVWTDPASGRPAALPASVREAADAARR